MGNIVRPTESILPVADDLDASPFETGIKTRDIDTRQRDQALSAASLRDLLPIGINQPGSQSLQHARTAIAGPRLLAFCFLSETYAPTTLAKKKRKLQKETGKDHLYTEHDNPDHTLGQELRKNLVRPFRMLLTQTATQVLALYRGYQYEKAYTKFSLASFPLLWEDVYREDTGTASLNYLSLGIGFVLGLQFSGRVFDLVYIRLKKYYKHDDRPEFRVPLMVPGGLLVPAGLFIYGWIAQFKPHWIIPNIGAAISAFRLIISFQCAQTYVVDAYSRYAASATGTAAFVRTIAGFAFPLFADSLYKSLGLGWGNSLLAFVSLGLGDCSSGVVVLWRVVEVPEHVLCRLGLRGIGMRCVL
ncbi:MFS transporter [Penicillium alfredii]|uniref:MFS transporter n=1 Tax=Penicillium alfredii TaxID=1506179 RepID=A0A9W9K424_9EURO|nr:MFS transporter [Penicillium alfredii]KAJ5092309.1 MFS transporter [Penicillium alfredii]